MNSLSVYVHFPWCLQKCPYCDFASSGIDRAQVPHRRYADAILNELKSRAQGLAGQTLHSIFFGGGTPSLWSENELGRVLDAILRAIPRHSANLEVTVECNPTSLDRKKARALADVGVGRLSIGVQSLDAQHLRFLGRLHDGPKAIEAVQAALEEMPRVSADLMFGMPTQNADSFLNDAQTMLALGLHHLSVYALTIEPDTQFGALHRKGRLQLAPEADFANTFTATSSLLADHGLQHYEVSNYALPGQQSLHNLHYWRAGSYLGLGAGAVGCMRTQGLGGERYRNHPNPEAYMNAVNNAEREVSREGLTAEDTLREGLMLGLRTAEGVDIAGLSTLAGQDLRHGRHKSIERQCALGNLVDDRVRLVVPHARWLHLDSIVAELF